MEQGPVGVPFTCLVPRILFCLSDKDGEAYLLSCIAAQDAFLSSLCEDIETYLGEEDADNKRSWENYLFLLEPTPSDIWREGPYWPDSPISEGVAAQAERWLREELIESGAWSDC